MGDKDEIEFFQFAHTKMELKDLGEYLDTVHYNFLGSQKEFFLCLAFEETYNFVYYAWHDGSHKGRKALYETVKRTSNRDTYFATDIKDLYPNHSKQIEDNLFMLIL